MFYSNFNFDLRFCSDCKGSLSLFPEPEQKIEELSSEECLKQFIDILIFLFLTKR